MYMCINVYICSEQQSAAESRRGRWALLDAVQHIALQRIMLYRATAQHILLQHTMLYCATAQYILLQHIIL